MQGPAGSEVVLVVDRHGRELTFRIKRARYEVKAVEGKLLEDGIGYVKIRVFSSTTDGALGELLDQLSAQGEGAEGAGRSTCAATRAACSIRGSASPIASSPRG